MTHAIDVHPVTKERWSDLETLFGSNGAYSNCWCTFWRLKRSEYARMQPEQKKAVLQEMTLKDQVPGLLATLDGQPIGWCSLGRRESFIALENSRTLKRIDETPVWSVVCFFVHKSHRRQGVMRALVHGAVEYARSQGARVLEAYPLDTQAEKLAGQKLTGCSGYMGIAAAFKAEGFVPVDRASATQLIMRCKL